MARPEDEIAVDEFLASLPVPDRRRFRLVRGAGQKRISATVTRPALLCGFAETHRLAT